MKNLNSNLQQLKKEEIININGSTINPDQLANLFNYINDFIDYFTSPPPEE